MILIVDDSLTNRLLLKAMLEEAGYRDIAMAEGAVQALAMLQGDSYEDREGCHSVDLILMDVIMPELDGIEACRRIKQVDHLRDIPIIMVTGRTQVNDLERAFAAGATDYVTKPVNSIELIARSRAALRLKRETDVRKQRETELLRVTGLLEQANKKLQVLSSVDGLTGIANRRQFDTVLEREWKRGAREGEPLSLILVDIDFFKLFNDSYGHKSGDDCLKAVAARLGQSLKRASDMVARYGGEEFGIILPNTDAQGCVRVGEVLRAQIEDLKIFHKSSLVSDYVTISVGGACMVPSLFFSPTILITTADKALYSSKQGGRNRVSVSCISGNRKSITDIQAQF